MSDNKVLDVSYTVPKFPFPDIPQEVRKLIEVAPQGIRSYIDNKTLYIFLRNEQVGDMKFGSIENIEHCVVHLYGVQCGDITIMPKEKGTRFSLIFVNSQTGDLYFSEGMDGTLQELFLLSSFTGDVNFIELPSTLQSIVIADSQCGDLYIESKVENKLESLILSNTRFGDINLQLDSLGNNNLRVFTIERCQATRTSLTFGNLHSIEQIILANNAFPSLNFQWDLSRATRLFELIIPSIRIENFGNYLDTFHHLRKVVLFDTELSLPADVFNNLTELEELAIVNCTLKELPESIGNSRKLRKLYLHLNRIKKLPLSLGELKALSVLVLDNNQLLELPSSIGSLQNLRILSLSNNYISHTPPELFTLDRLTDLYLGYNNLSAFPSGVKGLKELRVLALNHNRISDFHLSEEQLENLEELHLSNNEINILPESLGTLRKLAKLTIDNNPHLQSPPPEIVSQGTESILSFLRELYENGITRYEAKVLIVGEGGTGKSSLVTALRGEEFQEVSATTHGVLINALTIPYPENDQLALTLNMWDFGGQQIYHATHQFFLTRRSLYVVVWNARLGAEQGRLPYWLETIRSLAPDSPIIIVATHTDERSPDINYTQIIQTYDQVIGYYKVSSKTTEGITELKNAIATAAIKLPLVGQPWPQRWLQFERLLATYSEPFIDSDRYNQLCQDSGIDSKLAEGTLAGYLHDLGKILYFRDDSILSNLVILRPDWVTYAISRVLTDRTTIEEGGLLAHSDFPRVWNLDESGNYYPRQLHWMFLRLMEKFDLSYRIDSEDPRQPPTHSLIPQLLPFEPSSDIGNWHNTLPQKTNEIEMVYRLNFVPSGIISWFIVRTHRFTTNRHWREGCILKYTGEHAGIVELNPTRREIRLIVKGLVPLNFFTILKDTLDQILLRFEGLDVQRDIPCICHKMSNSLEACTRYYTYSDLDHRFRRGRLTVECPDSFSQVSVPTLLYGLHIGTMEKVISDIKEGQEAILTKLSKIDKLDEIKEEVQYIAQQSEYFSRCFARQWNLEMQRLEVECPNTFFLMPGSQTNLSGKNLFSKEYRLYLVCQHPGHPHAVGDGYELRKPENWWKVVHPWFYHAVRFLKIGIPLGNAIGLVYDEQTLEEWKNRIKLMEEICSGIPSSDGLNSSVQIEPVLATNQDVIGPALRALSLFLKESDPQQVWGNLSRTLTLDGSILWLCPEHREIHIKSEAEEKPT